MLKFQFKVGKYLHGGKFLLHLPKINNLILKTMYATFEHTAFDGEMVLMVEFSWVEFDNWLDDNHKETFIDEVTITSIKCREWEMIEIFRNDAPSEWWDSIYNACNDHASNSN